MTNYWAVRKWLNAETDMWNVCLVENDELVGEVFTCKTKFKASQKLEEMWGREYERRHNLSESPLTK